MMMNRWTSVLILATLAIVIAGTVGSIFLHEGYICPECHGKGKIWVEGDPRFGFFGYWADCRTCEATGWYWMYSLPAIITVLSVMSLLCYLGFFFLSYVGSAFYAALNPYIYEVEDMEWPFNPMYFTWLFAKYRRKWALYTTIISTPLAILFGTFISGILTSGRVTAENLLYGFVAGTLFISLAAFCWYEGVCKPLTE